MGKPDSPPSTGSIDLFAYVAAHKALAWLVAFPSRPSLCHFSVFYDPDTLFLLLVLLLLLLMLHIAFFHLPLYVPPSASYLRLPSIHVGPSSARKAREREHSPCALSPRALAAFDPRYTATAAVLWFSLRSDACLCACSPILYVYMCT